ncbi:hypothetical protein QFZ75_004732 [Streptomyces sp. V3I8]|nr:hypothetical protein [Streptomyces sp. V3I8]
MDRLRITSKMTAMDEGSEQPLFPGTGFITLSKLSWRLFESASKFVHLRVRVGREFRVWTWEIFGENS